MTVGIDTHSNHLDDSSFNWNVFQTFAQPPAFAGRYFATNNACWAHGEGSATAVPVTLTQIVPIQSGTSPFEQARQATVGDAGWNYGREDANAICAALYTALTLGEFTIGAKSQFYVFLEVVDGVALSPDYWAGWADTVASYPTIFPSQGIATNPFLPCILASFAVDASGNYSLAPGVLNALDRAVIAQSRALYYCRGLWARAQPTNPSETPQPVPTFNPISVTSPYGPLNSPVVLWQYLSAAAASGLPLGLPAGCSLDSTVSPDATSYFLSIVKGLNLTLTGGGVPNGAAPVDWGVDRLASLTTGNVATLMTIGVPPNATSQLEQPPSFGGAYYRRTGGYPSTLNAAMLNALRSGGMTAFSIFEATFRPNPTPTGPGNAQIAALFPNSPAWKSNNGGNAGTYADVDTYLNTYGTDDANDAIGAAQALGQPPHTPIYFAIDVTVNATGGTAASQGALQKYFTDVAAAFAASEQANDVRYYIGAYGYPFTMGVCYALDNVSYFFQTTNVLWPHANLCQSTPLDVTVAPGLTVDIDFSWGDEGSWMA
jgi:hypothetical protein